MINIKEKARKSTNRILLYNKARLNRLRMRSNSISMCNIIETHKHKFNGIGKTMNKYGGNAIVTTYFGHEENMERGPIFYIRGIYVTGQRGYRRKRMHNKITEIKTLSEISN